MKSLIFSALFILATVVASTAVASDGAAIYSGKCQMCHGAAGAGGAMGPALKGTDLIKGDSDAIKVIILKGVPTVAKKYPNFPMGMPPVSLTANEMAAVIEYMKGL